MPEQSKLFFSADSITEAQTKLRDIFDRRSTIPLKIITKEDYEAQQGDEREDSDNHLQAARLGVESNVVPLIFRKYSRGKERNEYYHVVYKHKDGEILDDYLMIIPDLE